MSVTAWAQAHRRSLLFLLALLAGGGLLSAFHLPVALFPNVQFPMIAIDLDAGDRPAERMAIEVTAPVEEAVRAVRGVRNLHSATSRGEAEVTVSFSWGDNMDAALSQVESALNQLMSRLPAGTGFALRRKEPTMFPPEAYTLTSDRRTLAELRRIARFDLRPALSAVAGVANVDVQGGASDEIQVLPDPAKLRAYGVTMAEVSAALTAANVQEAVGRMEDRGKLYLVMADTELTTIDQVRAIPLRAGSDGVVRLSDVATVETGTEPQWTRVTADGRDAVIVQVFQQPGGNTVEMARELKRVLEDLRRRIPADVKIANWYDQGELILASAESVRDAVIVGAVLAAVILMLFLDNLKVTLIAALAVPTVLASTTLLLFAFGMSFNIMTLGGMAAAVGLIVDDAIVMVEHVVRRIRATGRADAAGVMAAAAEFTRPLLGSSLSTIVIFAPLAFLSEVTGAFFKVLSLTMAVSLIVSFLVAWLAVPLVAARVLGAADAHHDQAGPIQERVQRGYAWLMRRLLPRPWLLALIVAPLIAIGWIAYRHVGSDFMPKMDEGGFILDYNATPGTSLTETDRELRKIEVILRGVPEVDTYSRRTGLQLGGGLTEANSGDFFVRLKPMPRRPISEVIGEVRTRVGEAVPSFDIEIMQLMEDIIGDLTGRPEPIEVELFADDPALLTATAARVANGIKGVRGVVDIKSGVKPAGDALAIAVDRDRAALEGLSADEVSTQLSAALAGTVATRVQRGPTMQGIRLRLPSAAHRTVGELERLPLRATDGHEFPLAKVATISALAGQPQITRDDLRRMVSVTARIADRDLGSTIAEIRGLLDRPGMLAPGMTYRLGGLYLQQQIAFSGLTWVLVASTLLVFLLLLFLYERFRVAAAMLATTLLSLSAVFVGLWVADIDLNITAMMGMTMIVGIVTEVGIFYYTEYVDLHGIADPHERLIGAGINRLRPIAMTSLAAILALLPLALGIGQGSSMQQPLAVAIVAGLIIQLPLALVVLPLLLVLLRAPQRE